MAIDIDLAEDFAVPMDEHDYFGFGFQAAAQVVLQLAHIFDELVRVFRCGGPANPATDRNAPVLGRFARKDIEYKRVSLSRR